MSVATKHLCDEPGCTSEGLTVFYAPGEDAGHYSSRRRASPGRFVCADHCHQNGFCAGCLLFCAGNERFDFSSNGLCEECAADFAADCGEDIEDDDWADADGWYPGWEGLP
jgi:hypothetical protein